MDAARMADRKWEIVFGEVLPETAAAVARVLSLPDPATLAFSPNTHDLLIRLLSSLPLGRRPKILTSDAEFHSFSRQIARLEEDALIEVTRVPTQPFATFERRFAEAQATVRPDLIYVSQVFFDSGWAIDDLERFVRALGPSDAWIAIDGYHGFCAIPTSLRSVADRIFYLGGGYKYAMAGEGACFMHCPPGVALRPRLTGWFAAFGALESARSNEVPYGPHGARFLGATFDPSGIYRLRASLGLLEREGLTIDAVHRHVVALQTAFVETIRSAGPDRLPEASLVVGLDQPTRGHFLTYALPNAKAIFDRLLAADVVTDVRGDRLRFGFGIYHDEADVRGGALRVIEALARA